MQNKEYDSNVYRKSPDNFDVQKLNLMLDRFTKAFYLLVGNPCGSSFVASDKIWKF
jgi:hypothetical protein